MLINSKREYVASAIIFLFFLSFNSCTLLKSSANKAKALAQCKFELVSVDKKVSFTEATSNIWNYVIQLHIAGINPSSENISLGGYRLDLYANDKWISDISTQVPIALKAHGTTMIVAKTVISPSGVFSIFWKKLLNKKIEYKIKGTFFLKLGNFTLPMEVQLVKIVDNPN